MAALNNQAFPVNKQTFVGTAAAAVPGDYALLHVAAAGTVTIVTGGATKVLTVTAGIDLNVAGATSITSTAEVWIS